MLDLDLEYLDLAETFAIKAGKIDWNIAFPNRKLGRHPLKSFLYRINFARALRRQIVMDGAGCKIS